MPALILIASTFGVAFAGSAISGLAVGAFSLTVALVDAGIVSGLTALSILANRGQRARHADSGQEIRSTIEPARWVLGRARTPGLMVFYEETDHSTKYGPRQVDVVLALSEGACDSIEKIWVDGKGFQIVRRDTVVGGQRLVGNSFWDERMKVWAYLDADGLGGGELRKSFPNRWTTNHQLRGISYVHIRLTQNNYDTSNPESRFWKKYPDIEFLVKGIKISFPGQSAPIWTDNAAAIRYWYMTEILGVDADRIDEDHFRYAYSVCNEEIDMQVSAQYGQYTKSDKRYSINGVVTTADDTSAVMSEMDFCWQGFVVEQDASLYFRPGIDRISRYKIDKSVIIQPPSIKVAPNVQDRINAISMSLLQSSDSDYKSQDLRTLTDNDTIQNRDNCIVLWQDLGQMRFVVNPISAGRLMWIAIKRSRGMLACSYIVSPGPNLEFLNIIPGDIARVVDEDAGIDMDMEIVSARTNDDWSITIDLIEKVEDAYVPELHVPLPPASPFVQDPSVNPNLPYVPPLPDLPF